jgi:hypothetical protein
MLAVDLVVDTVGAGLGTWRNRRWLGEIRLGWELRWAGNSAGRAGNSAGLGTGNLTGNDGPTLGLLADGPAEMGWT